MATATENHNGNIGLTGIGRNIFRSNHRCLSPMAQLKISPHSSMNAASCDLPSPVEEDDIIKMEARSLARDFIHYKINHNTEDPKDEAARTLRRVGDEMVDRHQTVVNAMSRRLQFSNPSNNDEAYSEYSVDHRMFLMIAREICQDGQDNWGRIVTFYVLGSIMALNNMEHAGGSDIDSIINIVGDYVGTQKRKWIEKNGGWTGFIKFFNSAEAEQKKVWKGLLYAVGLGAIATSFVVSR